LSGRLIGARRSPERTGLYAVFPDLQGIYSEIDNFRADPVHANTLKLAEI